MVASGCGYGIVAMEALGYGGPWLWRPLAMAGHNPVWQGFCCINFGFSVKFLQLMPVAIQSRFALTLYTFLHSVVCVCLFVCLFVVCHVR